MRRLTSRRPTMETFFLNGENSPCHGVKNISIIVDKRRLHYHKQKKKVEHAPKDVIGVPKMSNGLRNNNSKLLKLSSMPEFRNDFRKVKLKISGSDTMVKKSYHPYNSNFYVNVVSEFQHQEFRSPFSNPHTQMKWRVYRCQLSTQDESCCCSCNSDAMFEVMKSLYDCYKKKNCDHCNCILCGHLPREERKLGELRKSGTALSSAAAETEKQKAEKRKKTKKSAKAMEGKPQAEKEKILRELAMSGAPLPEGKTASDKFLIQKVKTTMAVGSQAKVPSEKLRKAKAAGFLTPLEGKSLEQKEKILRGLAMNGVPLPEGKTASEKKLVEKVRTEVGLPPEPKSSAEKKKYQQAMASGIVTPLEGKTKAQKEKILKSQAEAGLQLPEGRTTSEKALVAKVKAESKRAPSAVAVPSEKLRKAKAAGFLTPLEGKSPEQKEKILKGLAMSGVPLPEGKTASEKKLVEKVRTEVGLPPEPKSSAEKKKYQKALASGIVTPLEGKSKAQKEKILKSQAEAGLALPEGRTASEKALIAKTKAATKSPSEESLSLTKLAGSPSEKLRKAKAAGLLTPIAGKSAEQKEKILRSLAMQSIPLPEGKSASEKKLIEKVRADLGLPPEPKSAADKEKYKKAAAARLITPLQGKTAAEKEKILRGQFEIGLPLPVGRTASEKALISKITTPAGAPSVEKVTSEKLRKAKAAGLLTPLAGKSPEQREKILKGLAMQGIPLPEGKTVSESNIIDKVRTDLGIPPEPKTTSMKEKYAKAQAQGLTVPLEGKSPVEKEKLLKAQLELGLTLPEGRTASEKALIKKVKAAGGGERKKSKSKAVAAGGPALLPDKAKKLDQKTAKVMKEGKGPSDECICGLLSPESGNVSIGKTVAKKTPSERLKSAKAAGLLTPLTGKSVDQREKILKGLAKQSIPLPEGKTASEKQIIAKVRADLGLPPEPKTPSIKEKYAKAQAQGIITPLDGKSPSQKEKILKAQAEAGLSLPEGRTASEKALISKVKAAVGAPSVGKVTSEKMRKAKASGLLTPLEGKTKAQKEKILKGRVAAGLPLPEGKTGSDKDLIKKVKTETGYVSPAGKTPSEKLRKARDAGLLTPLQGKTLAQKEKNLRGLTQQGVPLPDGKTPSEKALIQKVKTEAAVPLKTPSDKLKAVKAAGLLTPLEGKSKDQKEKILKGLVKAHMPLPEGKTSSDQELIRKVRDDMGLPPEPKTPSIKEKYKKALEAGVITPLEGKTLAQKEKVLKKMQEAGLSLPEGRTPSEKALVRKVKASAVVRVPSEKMKDAKAQGAGVSLPEGRTASEKALISKTQAELAKKLSKKGAEPPTPLSKEAKLLDQRSAKVMKEGKGPSDECICGILTPDSEKVSAKPGRSSVAKTAGKIPLQKLQKAKAAGLLTPLEGKSPAQKDKILHGLAMQGLPLPEGKTSSEKKLVAKVRANLGVSPEPKSGSAKIKYDNAIADGLMVPLEGKSAAEKEKILKALAKRDILLPEGRTPSEKALIAKVKAEPRGVPSDRVPSEKLRKAKAAGLLTPLKGKSEAQKEKILKGLAETGMPLPEGKTTSEKALIQKVRTEFGIPKAVTSSEKEIVRKAKADGLLTPLAGKSAVGKDKTLKGLAEAGLPLPEGKTASEKQMIKKIRTAAGLSPEATPSEKLGKIRIKSKKIGPAASNRMARGVGGSGIAKAGIVEEFEDVLKTTTCDRGCGCDKKKIRFKHSYVKIRVTSPDISSLCPCPDECVPGVKGGVLVDNEGIKVTVGSAVGFPSFSIEAESKPTSSNNGFSSTNCSEANFTALKKATPVSEVYDADDFKIEYININANYSNESLSICVEPSIINRENVQNEEETKSNLYQTSSSRYLIACSESFTSTSEFPSLFLDTLYNVSSKSSLDYAEIVKTESSLSFLTKSGVSIRTISIISFHNSSMISRSSHYLCYQYSKSANSINAEDSEYFTNVVDYSAMDSLASQSDEDIKDLAPAVKTRSISSPSKREDIDDHYVFRLSNTNICNNTKITIPRARKGYLKSNDAKHNPIIVINELNNDEEVIQMVDEILAKKEIAHASSIFVIVPTYSDEYDTDLADSASSTICIRISENCFNLKNYLGNGTSTSKQSSKKAPTAQGLKIFARGKQYLRDVSPTHNTDVPNNQNTKVQDKHSQSQPAETIFKRITEDKVCQVTNPVEFSKKHSRGVSLDTTEDRPCCCSPKEPGTPDNYGSNDQCVTDVYSELITPMLFNQSVAQGLSHDSYNIDPRLNLTDHKSALSPNQTLSVSLCYIPPCSSSSLDCHEITKPPMLQKHNTMGTQYQKHPQLSGLQNISPCAPPCRCGLGNVQGATRPVPRNFQSIGCGPAECKAQQQTTNASAGAGPPPFAHGVQGNGEKPCSGCGQPTIRDGRQISCLCSGKEKKIHFPSLCPCECPKPPIVSAHTSNGSNSQQDANGTNTSPCVCKDNSKSGKKKKNVICECPLVEEEPAGEEFLPEIFDEKEFRKMKSDQTQTMSGFKFNVKKREEEMSFEDAIKYFELHPIEGDSTQVDDSCFCDGKSMRTRKNASTGCECPYDQTGEALPEEPFPGLKIRIGGKGSGSKGLSGICCFDMVQESNGLLLLHD